MKLSQALQTRAGEVVALVGGGGKSSAMFRLGRELAQAGQRVLLTTTTRIAADQAELVPALITFDPATQSLADILPPLNRALDKHGQVLLIERIDHGLGKALGVRPDLVDELIQQGVCEVIVNEADGAKKRPFKAPAPHEPVIPSRTSLVVPMVGLDVLGQPLNEAYVHRAERVSQLGETALEAPITVDTIAKVLTHPQGGLKHAPPSARVIPILNKVELVETATAQTLAQLILKQSQIQAVGLGSVERAEGILWLKNRVAAIILAAGQASRFGSPKQLALWQDKPLLAHVVDAALASQVERVIVVLGAHAEACRAVLADRPVEIVLNENWAAGQSTSMKAGLAALPTEVSAAIFPLADQPFVTAEVIDAVISAYQQTLAPVVWPAFEGRRGNPVLFDRSLFAEMNQVTGDVGARPVLMAHQDQAEVAAVSEAGILRDIDRPADL